MARKKATACVGIFMLFCLTAGCGKDEPVREPLVLKGSLALDSFPAASWSVRALRAARALEAPVGSDGTFTLKIPPGSAYHLEFFAADHAPLLVFPRKAGGLGMRFTVKPVVNGPFDLGSVRYLGDVTGTQYAFRTMSADGDAVECENGVDAVTGGVCVDDDDEEGATACENEEHEDEESETAAGQTSEDLVAEPPSEAAVPEHNLPAAVGCDVECEQEGEHEGENEGC